MVGRHGRLSTQARPQDAHHPRGRHGHRLLAAQPPESRPYPWAVARTPARGEDRVAVAVEETTPLEEVGELTLKGLSQPVVAYNVPLAASQPAFRVIEGGPPSV